MPRFVPRLLLLLIAVLALAGCVKVRQQYYLLADGSGRLTITIGVPKQAADTEETVPHPLSKAALETLQRDWEGFVGFSAPVQRTEDGWVYLSVSGYFEDIGLVRVHRTQPAADGTTERKLRASFKIARQQDGTHLEIRNESLSPLAAAVPAPGEEPQGEQALLVDAALRALFDGFEYSETYDLPGTLTRSDGLDDRRGRVASMQIGVNDIVRPSRARELSERTSRHLVWGRDDRSRDDGARFRRELEEARESWEKRLAEGDAPPNSDDPKAKPDDPRAKPDDAKAKPGDESGDPKSPDDPR